LLPDAAEAEVRYMDSHAGCGFVSGRVRLAARDGSSLGIPEEPVVETDHYLNLLRSCYIWTPSAVMFRTSVLKSAGGFAPGRSGAADWDLYLRIARRLAVLCHPHVVVQYRVHDQAMSTNSALMLADSLDALRGQRD